jgi:UDP-N-acetylglucosamine 4,6-dehydratase
LTLEFDDHYVIKPTIQFSQSSDFSCNSLGEKGMPVPDEFQYSSDTNTEWLTGAQLLEMLKS